MKTLCLKKILIVCWLLAQCAFKHIRRYNISILGFFIPLVVCLRIGVAMSDPSTKTTPIQKPSPKVCLEEVQRNFPDVDVYTLKKKMTGDEWFLYSKHGVYHIKTTNAGDCELVHGLATRLPLVVIANDKQVASVRKEKGFGRRGRSLNTL